jgi:hypothetical protein
MDRLEVWKKTVKKFQTFKVDTNNQSFYVKM